MTTGARFVLTASRAEMSQFGFERGEPADAFKAFFCTFPKLYAYPAVRKYLVPLDRPDGRARFAPYALRKIEAVLADHFGPDSVVVCHPDTLGTFVGDRTEIVGVTTMDPLGRGYVSLTYNPLIPGGGETLSAAEFGRLMRAIRALKAGRGFKVAVGGEGAWQIEQAGRRASLGIDTLVLGRSEAALVPALEAILSGAAPAVVTLDPGSREEAAAVPVIREPAIYGDVEITRGCGRGCAFCSPNLTRGYSVPLDDVMSEVAVNIRGGADAVFTITDDLFLYGAGGRFVPNRRAIVDLYGRLAAYPGVRWIELSHASLAPALLDKTIVPELAPILVERSFHRLQGRSYATVEVGIETGSAALMRKYMKGKAHPLDIGDWPRLVREAIALFNENRIYPLGTFIVGWPGETERDTLATLALMEDLRSQGARMFYTPVLFVPLERTALERSAPSRLEGLTPAQLLAIEKCWEYNVEVWGGDVPRSWLRIVGLAAKAAALGRRLTGRKPTLIHDRLGSFLLRTRIPCAPELCGRDSGP